jgi:hypothetical protein
MALKRALRLPLQLPRRRQDEQFLLTRMDLSRVNWE